MKNKKNIIALIILLSGFLMAGCGKYEEGPALSLASKKSRLCGIWRVEKEILSTNGTLTEITSNPDWENSTVEYTRDGIVKVNYSASSGSYSLEGTWQFGSKKETLETTFGTGSMASTSSLMIIRLKNKELWLRDYDNNGNDNYYEVHYIAQ